VWNRCVLKMLLIVKWKHINHKLTCKPTHPNSTEDSSLLSFMEIVELGYIYVYVYIYIWLIVNVT